MGMAPTGKHFSFAAVLICTMRGGQIAHEKRIYDFTGFLLEIGVLKAKTQLTMSDIHHHQNSATPG